MQARPADPRQIEPRPRILNGLEAEAVARATLDALDRLEPLIQTETEHLRYGRIAEALALGDAKADAARAYQDQLETVKANAIALGRYQPPSLTLLRRRHERFSEIMALNMAVIGTARTVSEGLIRDLATSVGQAGRPQGYGATGKVAAGYRTPAAPLAVSRGA
jgi:hypothetical protein